MSYSSPDPRWTPLDQSQTVATGPREGSPDGGGPVLPLLRQGLIDEPVDLDELLDHVVTAIHDVEPAHAPRPELLALLDLPADTKASLDRDGALAVADALRDDPDRHAELIGATALAVSAVHAVTVLDADLGAELAPGAVGLVCAALDAPPAVRSAKESYQHARAARNALTEELRTADSPERVLLRSYVLRRWLLETTWPQRRICWRVLDKVAAATLSPGSTSALGQLSARLDEFQFRRWPS